MPGDLVDAVAGADIVTGGGTHGVCAADEEDEPVELDDTSSGLGARGCETDSDAAAEPADTSSGEGAGRWGAAG